MTDPFPILYSFRRCPYAIRARMALRASGQTCVLREVVLRNKPAEMLEISPKGTVPVLHFADGTVIDESLDMMLLNRLLVIFRDSLALAVHHPQVKLGFG